jgi:hypothetical protein
MILSTVGNKFKQECLQLSMILGFDPGGLAQFGWCVIDDSETTPLKIRSAGVSDNAKEAISSALVSVDSEDQLVAAGIDSPLFWIPDGDRKVDQAIREAIMKKGGHPGTVNHINSLRGACLIQGILVGMLLRERFPRIPLTETHPKAVLRLMGIAGGTVNVADFLCFDGHIFSEHKRDAALSALTAWAMIHRDNNWKNVFSLDKDHYSPLSQPLSYWIPNF